MPTWSSLRRAKGKNWARWSVPTMPRRCRRPWRIPIFVDTDGEGFKPDGDMLGLPLPIGPDFKPSKPHKHDHDH